MEGNGLKIQIMGQFFKFLPSVERRGKIAKAYYGLFFLEEIKDKIKEAKMLSLVNYLVYFDQIHAKSA